MDGFSLCNKGRTGFFNLISGLVLITLFVITPLQAYAQPKTAIQLVGARPLYFGGLNDLAKEYEQKTGINIFAKAGGCMAALAMMENASMSQIPSNGKSIGAWCCPLPKGMAEKMGIVRIPIAMDAIAVYVHPSNPVDNISVRNLKRIYRGEITNWSQLGGPEKPVVPLVRRHCEELPEVFRENIVGKWQDYESKTDWLEVKSIEKMIENVEKFPLAIGYESHVFNRKESVKILRVEGLLPSMKNIKTKQYPFWRNLSITVHRSSMDDPAIKGFIDYALSPEGQKILGRKLVSILPEN